MLYRDYLKERKDLVGMIHVAALPGTPAHTLSPSEIIDRAVAEAQLYKKAGFSSVMIENMHDVPYADEVGAEITGLMAVIGSHIKDLGLFCGIQILSANNREALGVAHAAGLDFVRVEGYVFAHIGDEGFIDSCAADLLRYRKSIGAEEILVFADVKKKHASHAITADVDLAETARTAAFMRADGVIITAGFTGQAPDPHDLDVIQDLGIIRIVGSGITADNIADYVGTTDLMIVGSSLKYDGHWTNPPELRRAQELIRTFVGCSPRP